MNGDLQFILENDLYCPGRDGGGIEGVSHEHERRFVGGLFFGEGSVAVGEINDAFEMGELLFGDKAVNLPENGAEIRAAEPFDSKAVYI